MQFDWTRMKITNVEVLVLKSPGLYNNPEGSEEPLGPTYMGLVRVSTDAGITGYSDMETSAPVAKAAVDAPRWSEPGMECFDGLASLVVGENPLEVGAALVQDVPRQHLLRTARRGDPGDLGHRHRAVGHHGQVLSASRSTCCWAGKWRDQVRAYASTLFRPTPEAMREAARRYLDEGFTAIKFGWGVFGEDPRRGRAAGGGRAQRRWATRTDLLVDTGWFVERTPKQAIQVDPFARAFRPFFIEEILHPEDYDGYAQVAEQPWKRSSPAASRKPPNGAFTQLIERAKVDVLQPDLTRCGGFTVARKIVHMAERANVLVIPHSWSSDLLTAASLHLNAFQRRAVFVEFNTSQGPAEPCDGEAAPQDVGRLRRGSDRPGVGRRSE